MGLRPGYKLTVAGTIPEDWFVKSVADVAAVKTGPFGSALHERDYVETGTPIITVEHIGERGVTHRNLPLVSDVDKARLKPYLLRPGDIVFSRVGSVDRNALIRTAEDGWLFSGRILRVRPFDDVYPPYLSHQFRSESFKNRVKGVAVGQTMASLNTRILAGVKVVVPPTRAEQAAVAAVLSDADALIESLERLLAKKRQVKQGAMQELLTGKKRLPGFSGDWKVKRIGGVSDIDPESLGRETRPNFAFNYISLEGVDVGTLRSHSAHVFRTAPSRARRVLRKNDVLVSTVRPNLMSHLLFSTKGGSWVCSTGFCVIRSKAGVASPDFIYFQMFSRSVLHQIDALLAGSNYPAITSNDVRSLEIPFPALPEQTAIAAVLSDMDAEIAALEARLAKARQIKQGMMQELLTGRIRLV